MLVEMKEKCPPQGPRTVLWRCLETLEIQPSQKLAVTAILAGLGSTNKYTAGCFSLQYWSGKFSANSGVGGRESLPPIFWTKLELGN